MPMARMIVKFDSADTTAEPVIARTIPAASAASRITTRPVIAPENSHANRHQLTDWTPGCSGPRPSLAIAASLTRCPAVFDRQRRTVYPGEASAEHFERRKPFLAPILIGLDDLRVEQRIAQAGFQRARSAPSLGCKYQVGRGRMTQLEPPPNEAADQRYDVL